MSEDALTEIPEIEAADLSAAMGTEPSDPPPDDPAADPPALAEDDEPAAPADPASRPDLPDYRREAIANKELLARFDKLEQALARNQQPPAAAPPGAPGATAELTPEQKVVQDKFYKLFPQAKTLFEKAEAIIRASEVAPAIASRDEAADNFRAESALKTVADKVSERVLGAGKAMRPEARSRVNKAFASWVGADYAADPEMLAKMPPEMQARATRYQNGDTALFDEFVKDFLSDFTPVNRADRVQAVTRATVKSPRGGPSSAPPPASPQPPDDKDPDAIHNAAWRMSRETAAQ